MVEEGLIPFPELNLPRPVLQVQKEKDNLLFWDIFRKKWLVLSPEEWVRQHVLQYLTQFGQFPPSLISIERGLGNRKRTDIVVFNRLGQRQLLIECKAFDIKLTKETAQQALLYHHQAAVSEIWLTNGHQHLVFVQTSGEPDWKQVYQLPTFAIGKES